MKNRKLFVLTGIALSAIVICLGVRFVYFLPVSEIHEHHFLVTSFPKSDDMELEKWLRQSDRVANVVISRDEDNLDIYLVTGKYFGDSEVKVPDVENELIRLGYVINHDENKVQDENKVSSTDK